MDDLGPLPTDFTTPAYCANELDDIYKLHTTNNVYYLLQGPLAQTTCYPGSFAAIARQYYSPGLCPTGFTAPCQTTNRAGTVEETILTCCPTQGNYICETDLPSVGDDEIFRGCISQITATSTVVIGSDVRDFQTSRVTLTLNQEDAINAYSIQVRYQSTDFISSSASSPTQTSTSSAVLETPSVTRTPPSTNATANRALPGIIVGAIAGFAIVVGAVFLLTRRRYRQRREQQSPPQPTPTQQTQHQYPYPDQPIYQEQPKQQQHHLSLFNANPNNQGALDAQGTIVEIDGGTVLPRDGGQITGLGESARY
ncbi:hypothetical protein F5Y14DRAFT_459754 [Nemania sp. NC0429]|nr:hypothetical protein F5Y14DRAFT_459754 [Nemania sp. NC0429]